MRKTLSLYLVVDGLSGARVWVVVLAHRVGRTSSLAQHTSNVDLLLLLGLDSLPRRRLFGLLAVQIVLQALLSTSRAGLVLDGFSNLRLGRCGHLLSIVLVVTADVLVGQALGLFARAGAADTAGYRCGCCILLACVLFRGYSLIAEGGNVSALRIWLLEKRGEVKKGSGYILAVSVCALMSVCDFSAGSLSTGLPGVV